MHLMWLNLIILLLYCNNHVNGAVINFGERCTHTAECADHRLVCEPVSQTNETKICVCDRFHIWKNTSEGCVQNITIEEILALLNEKFNVAEHIRREADFIFYAQILAGLIVMFVGCLCIIVILLHCWHMKSQDKKLKNTVKRLQSLRDNLKKEKKEDKQKLTKVTDITEVNEIKKNKKAPLATTEVT